MTVIEFLDKIAESDLSDETLKLQIYNLQIGSDFYMDILHSEDSTKQHPMFDKVFDWFCNAYV